MTLKPGQTNDKASVYTTTRLGPKRSLTPEGFLLCQDVAVARTGVQLYNEDEVPIDPDGTGVIRIDRLPEEVFRSETIASAEGKPITLEHPDEFVEPSNSRTLSRGSMINVRRGEGIDDELMVADLLITDEEAIQAVQKSGIEEVSLGYEAEYEQTAPGRGVQRNIVVNHVALVERCRCGERCTIGDADMTHKRKTTFKDMLMKAFKAKDADEVEKLAKEAEDAAEGEEGEEEGKKDKETADAIRALDKKFSDKFKALDEEMKELKEKVEDGGEDGDDGDEEDLETKDTVINAETGEKLDDAGVKLYTGDAMKVIAQRAEILAPGTKIPTFDAKTTDAQRAKALCACQRKALEAAFAKDASVVEPFLGGRGIGHLPVAQLNAAFMAASELMKHKNNAGGANRTQASTRDFGRATTVSDINKANREFWSKRTAH